MQCTRPLLAAPGFWKRTLDVFKQQTNMAIRMDGLYTPTNPQTLIDFTPPTSIELCKTMSDADIGGFSKASFTHIPSSISDSGMEPAHALFKGAISLDLPSNRPDVQRSGYAAFRTRDRSRSLFGRSYYDIDAYKYLAMRIKSDGRKYFVNIQTESIVPTDLHQHRLYARDPGRWEVVVMSLGEFVRTNYGMPVEPAMEMLRDKVTSVGVGLTDRVPGPFELRVAEVWATNDPDGGPEPSSAEDRSGVPRDKDGSEQSLMQ